MKTTATPVSAVPAARGDVAAANPMQLLEEQMKRFTVSKTPVQRVYMENQKRLRDEMTRDGSEAANALKLAVEAYAAADDRVSKQMGEAPGEEIVPGLNELTELLLTVGQRAAFVRPVLVNEAQQVSDDLIECVEWLRKMEDPEWQNDPDNIVEAGKDLLTRYGKYQVTYNGTDNRTVYRLLGYLLEKKRTLDKMWEGEIGEDGERIAGKAVDGKEGYQWGDKEGRLSEENQNMLADFNTLKAFMDNKSRVLSFLTPLATAVSGEEDKLGALRRELRRQEQSAGFNSPPRIPLGILPTETFFALLRKGRVLDDYGVGLKHGELTHRLQWYAIIEAAKSNNRLFHSTVNELYRQMGKEPRTGDPKWATVLDDGNEVNSNSYSSPGTFNRDLQESTGPKTGTAFPDRSGYENPVGLEALAPIGEALAALRQTRLQQAVHATDKGNDYEEEAFPPPSVIALLVAKMRQQPNAFKMAEEDDVGHEFMAQRDKYAVWKQTDNSIEKDTLTWGKQAPAKWLTPFNAAAVTGLSVVFFAALYAYNKRNNSGVGNAGLLSVF